MGLKEMFCKHKTYTVIGCRKDDSYYTCKCNNCKGMFNVVKAKGEMYVVGTVIKTK